MMSAGLRYEDFPAASSDDALDRESIIRLSMRRATERYGRAGSTVYVGDAVWDARACRSVDIPFIGIATGGRAACLSAEGAVCVFPDFSDTDLFLTSLYETEMVA
jgi:phosphoglycolate phosphatase-like HAD superfamily hydrolase